MTNARLTRFLWLAGWLAAPTMALAQDTVPKPPATIGPPIQRIATASALSTEQLGSITGVRELADGRVLLNDGTRRRLLLMDTMLKTVEVVLDSLSEISNTYGTRAGALLPYRGDSILFVDPASFAMVVLDPNAKIARVRSVWRVQDVTWFTQSSGFYGIPGLDAQGRIVYRIPAMPARPLVAPPSGVPYFPPEPDSAFIVGANLETRRVDTLAVIRTPKTEMRARQMGEGSFFIEQVINPLPSTDEWAILPDGVLALVRGRDYRVEYINADRTVTSSEKLPFDWQRLTDDDKMKLVDSVKTVQQRQAMTSYISQMIRWVNQYNQPYPAKFVVPDGYVPTMGMAKDWILPPGVKFPANYIYACDPGAEPALPRAPVATGTATPPGAPPGAAPGMPSCLPAPITIAGGVTPQPPTLRQAAVIPALDLPDYRPPFPAGSVRADMEGNLWIRTNLMKPTPGGTVYDIVSRQGELVTRYQLPPGYTLVGFGKGKVVYLSMRDATGMHLARVRLR